MTYLEVLVVLVLEIQTPLHSFTPTRIRSVDKLFLFLTSGKKRDAKSIVDQQKDKGKLKVNSANLKGKMWQLNDTCYDRQRYPNVHICNGSRFTRYNTVLSRPKAKL